MNIEVLKLVAVSTIWRTGLLLRYILSMAISLLKINSSEGSVEQNINGGME